MKESSLVDLSKLNDSNEIHSLWLSEMEFDLIMQLFQKFEQTVCESGRFNGN